MRAEYIKPFLTATNDVFKLMLDMEPQRKDMRVVDDMIASRDANVILGITGDLQGSVFLGFSREMALEMVKIMSGMDMNVIDSFASSALGEIGNIIAGNALSGLEEAGFICDIVPPQVFIGEYKAFPLAGNQALLLSLTTPIGDFDVSVFLAG
ncbi:MAG: chemotaxis protein CheX [Clostridiales bacterium]|nr:chemotaxis protein CheX [Clostridiales bacterium]